MKLRPFVGDLVVFRCTWRQSNGINVEDFPTEREANLRAARLVAQHFEPVVYAIPIEANEQAQFEAERASLRAALSQRIRDGFLNRWPDLRLPPTGGAS